MGTKKKSGTTTGTTLDNQQNKLNSLWEQYLNNANQSDPLMDTMRAEDLGFLQDTQSPNFDVLKARGMGPYAALYRSAAAGQQGERMGTGALQLGSYGSNPLAAERLKEQHQAEREQSAAGGLEDAFRMKNAQVRGEAMDLGQMELQKRLGLLGNVTGRAEGASNRWLSWMTNERNRPSFWRTLTQSFGRTLGNTLGGGNASSEGGFFGAG